MIHEAIVQENIPFVDLQSMGYDIKNLDLVKFAEDRRKRCLTVKENLGSPVKVIDAYDFVAFIPNYWNTVIVDGKVKYEKL